MDTAVDKIYNELRKYSAGGIALAFSGGVDSSLLLALLCRMNRENPFPFAAFMMDSVLQPEEETASAKEFAAAFGVRLEVFRMEPLGIPQVKHNRRDRCYWCKRAIFSRFKDEAAARGLGTLIDGTNADDLKTLRPGLAALAKMGVRSPLAAAGVGKSAIRGLSAALGLRTARKPSAPCLATRFEYDTELNERAIIAAAKGEAMLRTYIGPEDDLRLRIAKDTARIEAPSRCFGTLTAHAAEIAAKLHNLGFSRVSLDLDGFRSGSFDSADAIKIDS